MTSTNPKTVSQDQITGAIVRFFRFRQSRKPISFWRLAEITSRRLKKIEEGVTPVTSDELKRILVICQIHPTMLPLIMCRVKLLLVNLNFKIIEEKGSASTKELYEAVALIFIEITEESD